MSKPDTPACGVLPSMRIAVVGSGISGMVAAYQLSQNHEVTVFEAGGYIGGHTHTVDVELAGQSYAVDTGFIVHNDWTYPNFVKLMEELGVASQPSSMSFSVHCEKTGLEYNGTNLNSLFAQRRNFLRPSFLRMVADIVRFNRIAPQLLTQPTERMSLGDYLDRNKFSRPFIENYIVPMGAAIWSSRPSDLLHFPARFFVDFFSNHGFLNVNHRPTWRVIRGGSREYVRRLTAPFAEQIRLNCPVESIQRNFHHVTVRSKDGTENFDQVFIACHSDQALALLADASSAERSVLGAISYQANEAVLHTDETFMPRRPRAWAAWNYHLPVEPSERVTVTYNMNILQSLQAPKQFLLTLNRGAEIDERYVLGRYSYHHPVYTTEAVAAQQRRHEINGQRRTYYCGAYWSYGFHEDGVKSALVSVEQFRKRQLYAQPHLQRVG